MKIAIVSDTHNNWTNFKKAIDWIKKEKIQLILHCGDINSREIINDAQKLFNGGIKYVRGNADYGLETIPYSEEVDIGGKRIGFAHFPDIAKKMAQSQNPSTGSGQRYDVVFYGHTHRPWEEKIGNCRFINPGELAGQFYKPSFAVYDTSTDNLELKILEQL